MLRQPLVDRLRAVAGAGEGGESDAGAPRKRRGAAVAAPVRPMARVAWKAAGRAGERFPIPTMREPVMAYAGPAPI